MLACGFAADQGIIRDDFVVALAHSVIEVRKGGNGILTSVHVLPPFD